MSEIDLQIKKYRGYVNTSEFPLIPDAAAAILSQLRSRLLVLMDDEVDCMMTGVEFPESKKREMAAIAAFLHNDAAGDDDENE